MSKYKKRSARDTIRHMNEVRTDMIRLYDPAPVRKDPNHDFLLWKMTGKNRRQMIQTSKCISCDGKAELFRDEPSIREYQMSGFCQYCQDVYFELDREL